MPALRTFAGLGRSEVLTVVIERDLQTCWDRKSRELGFREQYPFIRTASDFARFFYDSYLPAGVDPDLTLGRVEVDRPIGAERVLRRLAARS